MQVYGLTTLGQRNHGCLKCYHMTIFVDSKVALPWLRQGSKRQIDWLFSLVEITALKSNRGGQNFIFTEEKKKLLKQIIQINSHAVPNLSYIRMMNPFNVKIISNYSEKSVPTECAHKDTFCYIYFTEHFAVINLCLDSLGKVEMCQTLWCGKKAIVL